MVLSWLARSRRTASVDDLVARRRYGKAVRALREGFEGRQPTAAERLRLADLLVLDNRSSEAFPILLGLADEQTRFGATEDALETLRRAREIAPSRRDIERRMAALRKTTQPSSSPAEPAPTPPTTAPSWTEALERAFDDPSVETSGNSPTSSTEAGSADGPGAPKAAQGTQPGSGGFSPEPNLRDLIHTLATLRASAGPSLGAIFFADLPPEDQETIAGGVMPRVFAPGDVVVSEGDPGDSLFLIASGSVRILIKGGHGQPLEIRRLETGDFFGEVAVLTGQPRSATAVAAMPCEALEVHGSALEYLLRLRPKAHALLEQVATSRARCQVQEAVRSLPPEAADPERGPRAIQAHFGDPRWSPRVRTRLARLLLDSGREDDALAVLAGAAQDVARRGQAQRAIALYQKVEKVRRRGAEEDALGPTRPGRRPSARHGSSPDPEGASLRAAGGAALREWVALLIRATEDLAARLPASGPVEEVAKGAGDHQGGQLSRKPS